MSHSLTDEDRRLRKRLWVMLIVPAVVLLSCGGCIGWVFFVPSYSESVVTTSSRAEPKGRVEEFIRFRHRKQRGWFPGPHGPVPWEHHEWFTNHLREPGKPMRELTFLRDEQQAWHLCKPVPGSKLWAVYCQVPVMQGPCKFQLLVFDDTHIVRHREFQGITETNYECSALFEDNHRKFVYTSPNGVAAYDILADTEKPWTGSFATRKNINGRYENVTLRPPFPKLEPAK